MVALLSTQTQTFMNKSNDSHLRLLALEHIGSIAGRLRRDAMVTTDDDNEVIIDVISQVGDTVGILWGGEGVWAGLVCLLGILNVAHTDTVLPARTSVHMNAVFAHARTVQMYTNPCL